MRDVAPEAVEDAVADFARLFVSAGGGWDLRKLAVALTHPVAAARAVATIASLPTVEVDASALAGQPAAAAVLDPLRRRVGPIPTGRLAQSLLDIPADGSYARGRSRQALRTNITKAAEAGLHVEVVGPDRVGSVVAEVCEGRGYDPPAQADALSLADAPGNVTWAAFDGSGRPVGFAIVAVAAPWARVLHSVACVAGPPRWLIHAVMVEQLAERGCTRLLVDSAVRQPAGLRYFQSRLGFRAVNLVVVPASGRQDRLGSATRGLRSRISRARRS